MAARSLKIALLLAANVAVAWALWSNRSGYTLLPNLTAATLVAAVVLMFLKTRR